MKIGQHVNEVVSLQQIHKVVSTSIRHSTTSCVNGVVVCITEMLRALLAKSIVKSNLKVLCFFTVNPSHPSYIKIYFKIISEKITAHSSIQYLEVLRIFQINLRNLVTLDINQKFEKDIHYVKKVCIWSFSGPYFPTFRLNMNQKNSEYEQFSRSDFSTFLSLPTEVPT